MLLNVYEKLTKNNFISIKFPELDRCTMVMKMNLCSQEMYTEVKT